MFLCVTLVKIHDIEHYIFFLGSTMRLEQLFGVTRSMNDGDLNFDCFGFQQGIGIATDLSQIYGRHTEWNLPLRRLTPSFDRKNCHSWKCDTRVVYVNEAAC